MEDSSAVDHHDDNAGEEGAHHDTSSHSHFNVPNMDGGEEDEEDDEEEEDDPIGTVFTRPEITDNEEHEKYFGYQYNMFLTGKREVDIILNLWHVLMVIVNLGLLVAGWLVRYYFGRIVLMHIQSLPEYPSYLSFMGFLKQPHDIIFTDYFQILGNFFIAFSVLYMSFMVGYMTFPLHRFTFALPTLSLGASVICLIEIFIINIYFARNVINDQEKLNDESHKLEHEYNIQNRNDFSRSLDIVSIWLECCGVNDHKDFNTVNLSFTRRFTTARSIQVPPSCCQRQVFSIGGSKGRNQVMNCAITAEKIYKEGCFKQLILTIEKICRWYKIMIFIHLTDCFIHGFLYSIRTNILDKALRYRFGLMPEDKFL